MNRTVMEDKEFIYRGKSTWSCLSMKAMKQRYPEGGFKIIGEVIKKEGRDKTMPIYSGEEELYVQPLKTYRKPFYRKYGYIKSEEYRGYVIIKKNNMLYMLLLLLAAAALIGGLIWWILNLKNGPKIDPNAGQFQSKIERPENWDDSKILIPGYSDWNMKADTDIVYVALYNPEENPCYFQFHVTLDSTGETLFQTELIPPGNAVTEVKLPKKLKKGTYPVTVKIDSFSLDDYTQSLNGGEVKTKIVALEDGEEN